VVQHAIQDRTGDAGVVVEDLGPVLVGFVGRDDQRAAFVALADDLGKGKMGSKKGKWGQVANVTLFPLE